MKGVFSMLYVSGYNKQKDLYAVTDTDDGAVDMLTKQELLSTARLLKKSGGNINGVSGNTVTVVRPPNTVNQGDTFSGVNVQSAISSTVSGKVDPFDSLKPRVKRMLEVVGQISQSDPTAWERGAVFGEIADKVDREYNKQLVLNFQARREALFMGFGVYRGDLVLGYGGWNRSGPMWMDVYSDGDSCTLVPSSTNSAVNYEFMEKNYKPVFIHAIPYIESQFASWFKKNYGK